MRHNINWNSPICDIIRFWHLTVIVKFNIILKIWNQNNTTKIISTYKNIY